MRLSASGPELLAASGQAAHLLTVRAGTRTPLPCFADSARWGSPRWAGTVRARTVPYTYLMTTISATLARQTLPEQLTRVESGEEIEITRHGRVVAVLVSPETLKRRRATKAFSRAKRIDERLTAARLAPLNAGVLRPERAEELVAAVRKDRSFR